MPIRLSPGAHSSPEEGVCVVELASVLAKEKFSDRPRCVCPVIGAFLRGWNDRATHVERQRLTPYAALIVGSRRSRWVTHARRDLCLEWAGADLSHGPVRRWLARTGMRLRIAVYCGLDAALRLTEGVNGNGHRPMNGNGHVAGDFVPPERLSGGDVDLPQPSPDQRLADERLGAGR
jgi:hypothetical protein